MQRRLLQQYRKQTSKTVPRAQKRMMMEISQSLVASEEVIMIAVATRNADEKVNEKNKSNMFREGRNLIETIDMLLLCYMKWKEWNGWGSCFLVLVENVIG
jgi:hypothetical protein